MITQTELSTEEIRRTLQAVAQAHLPLEVDGYVCRSEMTIAVLMKAASEGIRLAAARRDLTDSATGNTIGTILNEPLSVEQLGEYEGKINAALRDRVPEQIFKKKLAAAIDEHDEPFYGKTPELKAYTVRSRAGKGPPTSSASPAPMSSINSCA